MNLYCVIRYYATEVGQASLDQLFLKDEDPRKFEGLMPPERDVVLQLANGLEFIHSKQLCHRDLKPENVHIFPQPNGSPSVVKWAGFALFKPFDHLVRHTFSEVKGSPLWMAPELLKQFLEGSKSPVRESLKLADVFSAGCTIFFFLSGGFHPFGLPDQIMDNIKNWQIVYSDSKLL